MAELMNKKKSIEERRSSLGLFKGKEKKELSVQIEKIEREIVNLPSNEAIDQQYKIPLWVDYLSDKLRHDYSRFNTAKPGDIVVFGMYKQEKGHFGYPDLIEWIVLEREEDTFTLISQYALAFKPFNEEFGPVTWERSTLRAWLNGEFFDIAFTPNERMMIKNVKVMQENLEGMKTGSSEDKVFLLGLCEANRFFSSDRDRIAYPTDYAIDNNSSNKRGSCEWWLRSSDSGFNAATVLNDGSIYEIGQTVNNDDIAVRPIVVVELS